MIKAPTPEDLDQLLVPRGWVHTVHEDTFHEWEWPPSTPGPLRPGRTGRPFPTAIHYDLDDGVVYLSATRAHPDWESSPPASMSRVFETLAQVAFALEELEGWRS